MDASIDFSGVLRGSIADGGGGGGGDTVTITPIVTSGTKIADVSVNGVEKDLYCPTPPAPTEVDITPVVTSGTKIADVSIGGVEKDLYTPDYETDIAALDGRLDTAEGNITEIKQSLSQLDGLTIYKDLTPTDDYAEFDDGSSLPLISLISTIKPIQSGSGTPSPDNPRPISGHSDIDIIVSPNSDFSGGTTYSVNFVDGGNPLTVYGGTLDVISGVLTVTHGYSSFDGSADEGWTVGINNTHFRGYTYALSDIKPHSANSQPTSAICDKIETGIWASVFYGTLVLGQSGKAIGFGLDSIGITNDTDLNAWLSNNPITIVYELATPLTIQLTPTEVDSLLGQNYINSDTGDITNVKYLGVLNLS